MSYLSIKIPGGQSISSPATIPDGGIDMVGLVLRNSLEILLIAGVVLALIFIVAAGIQWTGSGGNKAKIQAARAKLTWAVAGLVIAFSAFFIVGLIGYFFKVPITTFPKSQVPRTQETTIYPNSTTQQPEITQPTLQDSCLDGNTVRQNVRACSPDLDCYPFTPMKERYCRLPNGTCQFFCTDK